MTETMTMALGDVEFQKTLTKRERSYIHKGSNFLSKYSRELFLIRIRAMGYTLDELEELTENRQRLIRREANRCWNKQDWSDAKYIKGKAQPQALPDIVLEPQRLEKIARE